MPHSGTVLDMTTPPPGRASRVYASVSPTIKEWLVEAAARDGVSESIIIGRALRTLLRIETFREEHPGMTYGPMPAADVDRERWQRWLLP